MFGSNKYLRDIKDISKKRTKIKSMRSGYFKAGDQNDIQSISLKAIKMLEGPKIKNPTNYDIGNIARTASVMMSYGVKEGDVHAALLGARLYETCGQGDRISVKNRLKRAYDKDPSETYTKDVMNFFKRNSKAQKKDKESTLENKVLTSIFAAFAISGLYFGLGNLTGAVLGIGKATSGIAGILLFIGGITGLFFMHKK